MKNYQNPFKTLTKLEWIIWISSLFIITFSFLFFTNKNFLTLIASLMGVTALIFIAKGDPIGQIFTIVFAIFYAIISYQNRYYGEMITYLENQNININDVSASFPMNATFSDTEINDDKRQFSTVNWDNSPYILYSNLYNWKDEYINTLHTQWKIQKELKSGLIFLRLYVPSKKK